MGKTKNIFSEFLGKYFHAICAVVLILFACGLLWFSNSTSMQAEPALLADVYFDGEYRIGHIHHHKPLPLQIELLPF